MSKASARVCLDCRALLAEAEPCDGGSFHRVVSLGEAGGREQLAAHVWGPPELRKQVVDAAKAGGLGAFLDGVACSACAGEAAIGPGLAGLVMSMLAMFLLVATAFWAVGSVVRRVQRRRGRLRPSGVAPTTPGRGERYRGRIVRGLRVPAPVGDAVGVAWAVELESSDAIGRGSHLLFAAESGGFTVELDDGSTLEVPAGRVRLDPGSSGWTRLPSNLVRAYVTRLDGRSEGELLPLLPADRGRSLALEVGDHVTVTAATELAASDGAAGYRDAPGSRRAVGVPSIASRGVDLGAAAPHSPVRSSSLADDATRS